MHQPRSEAALETGEIRRGTAQIARLGIHGAKLQPLYPRRGSKRRTGKRMTPYPRLTEEPPIVFEGCVLLCEPGVEKLLNALPPGELRAALQEAFETSRARAGELNRIDQGNHAQPAVP